MNMSMDQLNDSINGSGYMVTLVTIELPNGHSKAQYAWCDNKNNMLFYRGTILTLISAAKEELGNLFLRQYGLSHLV